MCRRCRSEISAGGDDDDRSYTVDIYSNNAGYFVRIVHLPSATVAHECEGTRMGPLGYYERRVIE